ncbi:uncharacterized protein LOC122243155 [Penaeus japonicus]|uniref:uncharacterized protein LOC122243155 n=1 Tax=Penaeus japonicus TaxID=27405 RepID=UPI001C714FD9|nr:uncharacterized protein LOC122243155 [Penaeus japonicus]
MERMDKTGDVSCTEMSSVFMNPFVIYTKGAVTQLMRGEVAQNAAKVDPFFTPQVTGKLFRGEMPFGLDLAAINMQRGRDHGLAPYNRFRMACNLPLVRKFKQLKSVMDKRVVKSLKKVYRPAEGNSEELLSQDHVQRLPRTEGGAAVAPEAGVQEEPDGPMFLPSEDESETLEGWRVLMLHLQAGKEERNKATCGLRMQNKRGFFPPIPSTLILPLTQDGCEVFWYLSGCLPKGLRIWSGAEAAVFPRKIKGSSDLSYRPKLPTFHLIILPEGVANDIFDSGLFEEWTRSNEDAGEVVVDDAEEDVVDDAEEDEEEEALVDAEEDDEEEALVDAEEDDEEEALVDAEEDDEDDSERDSEEDSEEDFEDVAEEDAPDDAVDEVEEDDEENSEEDSEDDAEEDAQDDAVDEVEEDDEENSEEDSEDDAEEDDEDDDSEDDAEDDAEEDAADEVEEDDEENSEEDSEYDAEEDDEDDRLFVYDTRYYVKNMFIRYKGIQYGCGLYYV